MPAPPAQDQITDDWYVVVPCDAVFAGRAERTRVYNGQTVRQPVNTYIEKAADQKAGDNGED